MYIQWIPYQRKDVVFLSPQTLQNFQINSGTITLHLGAWTKTLKVLLLETLDENTIGLSHQLALSFTIPDTLPYDMYLEGDDLYLGPVIAVVVRKGELSQGRLKYWTDYCRNYHDIRGLIYFCMVHGIDTCTKTIKGYYYDPNEEEQWKCGTFPYPGVVYQRTGISTDILQDLNMHTDGKVFNAYLFNKWEMWKVLSQAGFTYTPHTAKFSDLKSLKEMLSLYPSVYLKPARGRFGIGILKVEKIPKGFLIKKEYGSHQCEDDPAQVFQLINKYKKKREYIIQQSVPLIFERKPVDFRVILQKDKSQNWTCSGTIAKMGYEGFIYTNTTSAVYLATEALKMVFGLNPEQALEKENEIIRICKEACQIIENTYGIFGDVGIDVVVDENLNIWILEINKLHQHTMVKLLREDPDIYNRVITKPLEYAKALAGFKTYRGSTGNQSWLTSLMEFF